METDSSGLFADLLPSFLKIRADFEEEMREYEGKGTFDFERIDRIEVGLYHLKNLTHRFRRRASGMSVESVRQEDFFDLLVGSIFHEMLHLKEFVYTLTAYGPSYESLTKRQDGSASGGIDPAVAVLFQEILEEARQGLPHKAKEVHRLLQNASLQMERILRQQVEEFRLARALTFVEGDLDRIYGPGGLATLFGRVYPGGAAEGFYRAGAGFSASGFVVEAVEAFRRSVEAMPSPRSCGEEARRLVLPLRERLEEIRARWPGTVGAEAVLEAWERSALPLLKTKGAPPRKPGKGAAPRPTPGGERK